MKMKNTPQWKFQQETFGSLDASGFRKLMVVQELAAEELLAREVIQNSTDAATKLRRETENDRIPFRMEFIFRQLDGSKKKKFIDATGLTDLFNRGIKVGSQKLGVHSDINLSEILGKGSLEVLEMSDFGARGLKVSPKAMKKSAYYNCLLTIAASKDKEDNSGGSYGFGKSAFINGSKVSVVFAYSCFAPSGKEDKATRRFGGVVYWNDHEIDGSAEGFTGLGAFGDPDNQLNWLDSPFEDEDADALAESCGLIVRDPKNIETYGTSLIVLCPSVEPEDLVPAIERYWWPALVGPQPKMKVLVTGYDGKLKQIAPKQNPGLRNFIRAFDLATTDQNANIPYELKKEIRSDSGALSLGIFAGVADPATCFDPKRSDNSSKESQVCLVRSPLMVVKYVDYGRGASSAPFIEGIFVSSDDAKVEKLLQAAEPATHDYWWPKGTAPKNSMKRNSPEIYNVVYSVKKGLDQAVTSLKLAIKPPIVKERTGLKNFGKLISSMMSADGKGDGDIEKEVTPFKLDFLEDPSPELYKPGMVTFFSEVQVTVDPKAPNDAYRIQVNFNYSEVLEEEGQGDIVNHSFKILEGPSGFGVDGSSGNLKKGEQVRIRFISDPVDAGKSLRGKCRIKDISKKVTPKVKS